MTDNIRSKIAAWVDSEYGSCPVAGTQLLAFIDSQQSKIATLKAERDAAMKDAERYRWLRNHGDSGCTGKDGYGGQELLIDERLDAAIDASIAKAEGGAA